MGQDSTKYRRTDSNDFCTNLDLELRTLRDGSKGSLIGKQSYANPGNKETASHL